MTQDQTQVNRLWEAVLHTSRELVWELAPDGELRFMSGPADDVLGTPAEELVGRNGFSLVHPDDVDQAMGLFVRCTEDRSGWNKVRVRVVRPDGLTPWVETSGVAHLADSGELLGFTATTRLLDTDDARREELGLVEERVRAVLRDGSLMAVWQPIFSLTHGRVVGAEALTRFDPAPAQPPDRWFAEAAEVGLGVDLEILALETALASATSIPRDAYLSLNVSPAVVASGRLLDLFAGCGVSADRIVLELTEHVSVQDYEGLVAPLGRLRGRGVRLAVDDAGAGFASFRHILRLEPDIIKLDQSIVQGITDNPAQRALATAVVLFALEAGPMVVVAEGVETAADLSTVSLLGLDAAQGYHLARPAPAETLPWGRVVDQAWTAAPA